MKLIETIRFENGKFENINFHQKRMNESRKYLYGCKISIDLSVVLQPYLINSPESGLHKCRIVYANQIEKVEFTSYQIPSISSLRIIEDNDIDYSFKYLDRSHLENLYQQKGVCDDILIVKNGLVTDTFTANICFYNGKDWVTPSHPLLKGTQSANLLDLERIQTADIRCEDLPHFEKARLINAMIRFEDKLDLEIDHILF